MGKGFRFLNRDLGEEYLLIKLDNSAKDYLERFREGFCFRVQFLLTVCGKVVFPGWSKMPRCKAPEILRSEAYLEVRCNDEG